MNSLPRVANKAPISNTLVVQDNPHCGPRPIETDSYSSSSSSAFPAISLGFAILLFLLLLRSKPYLWGSPFVFFCVPSYISGFHHSYSPSSSVFPTISLGFTILLLLLLLRSKLHLWGSPFLFFFCIPSYISGAHHSSSSSSALPAISLGFTFFGEIIANVTGVFFTLNTEVVTFCLHGWCMQGIFCCWHSPI